MYLIFIKKTLDKQNDQLLLEFKVKVNNGSCLQQDECGLV